MRCEVESDVGRTLVHVRDRLARFIPLRLVVRDAALLDRLREFEPRANIRGETSVPVQSVESVQQTHEAVVLPLQLAIRFVGTFKREHDGLQVRDDFCAALDLRIELGHLLAQKLLVAGHGFLFGAQCEHLTLELQFAELLRALGVARCGECVA